MVRRTELLRHVSRNNFYINKAQHFDGIKYIEILKTLYLRHSTVFMSLKPTHLQIKLRRISMCISQQHSSYFANKSVLMNVHPRNLLRFCFEFGVMMMHRHLARIPSNIRDLTFKVLD